MSKRRSKPFLSRPLGQQLTIEDQDIYQRMSVMRERRLREADDQDAYVALLRVSRGGIVAAVKAGIRP